MRRSEILGFLQSRPVDRFTYLEAFLDVSLIDNIREAYTFEAQRCQTELLRLSSQISRNLDALSGKLPDGLSQGVTSLKALELACYSYAVQLSLIDPSVPYSWESLILQKDRAKKLSEGNALEQKRTSILSVTKQITDFSTTYITKGIADIETLNQRVEKLKSSTTDATISDLLTHAQRHFEGTTKAVCPVCGNMVKRDELVAQLKQRLSNLATYREARVKLVAGIPAWRSVITKFVELSKNIVTVLGFPGISGLDSSLIEPKGFELLFDINEQTDNDKLLTSLIAIGPSEIREWIKKVVSVSSIRVDDALKKLPPVSAIGELIVFAELLDQLEKKRLSITSTENQVIGLEARKQLSDAIADALRRARQDVAKEILDSISDRVADYYSRIHPVDDGSEETGAPLIKLQRHGKGTAFVQGSFAGRTIADPNWVYSDGHLDTVGICVFLALRRYRADRGSDAKLLVLDDVVLSIDLSHSRRLISLMKECFNDHQILILTHNGLFAHWCSRMLPNVKRISISSWTLEGGPRIGEYRTAI